VTDEKSQQNEFWLVFAKPHCSTILTDLSSASLVPRDGRQSARVLSLHAAPASHRVSQGAHLFYNASITSQEESSVSSQTLRAQGSPAMDESQIWAPYQQFLDAWSKRDADVYAPLCVEDGNLVGFDISGGT
jgi:hypothetical protein